MNLRSPKTKSNELRERERHTLTKRALSEYQRL